MICENEILAMIDHPNLVGLRGFDQTDRYLYFALEYVCGGELFTYLRTEEKLDSEQARFYAA